MDKLTLSFPDRRGKSKMTKFHAFIVWALPL